MLQNLAVNDFKQIDDISEFDESFVKSYNEESDEGYFLEFDIQYLENCVTFTIIYNFYLKE